MVFSDTTNKLGIIQACERYTRLGDAGISGDSTLLKEFTAHANETLRQIWHIIFTSSGNWIYDDSNQSDLPQATTDLTSGTRSYALPSTALTVERIEFKDPSGVWSVARPLGLDDRMQAEGEYLNDNGTPQYYRLIGNTIKFYPGPNYTSEDGLKVFFQRGSSAFASTDTTKTPGFASEYHNAVARGAALEWMKINRPQDATVTLLMRDFEKDLLAIKQFYQNRYRDYTPVLRRKKEKFV